MDSEYVQWAEEQRARKTEDRTETPQLVVPLSAHVGTEPRPQPTTDDRTRDPLANLVRHDDDFSLSLATRVDEVLRDEGVEEKVDKPTLQTKQEDRTRVGFEVEVGSHYSFFDVPKKELEKFVNKTLFVARGAKTGLLLEMLLDDITTNEDGFRMQVEFRTEPLDLDKVTSAAKGDVTKAISVFPARTAFDPEMKSAVWERGEHYQDFLTTISEARVVPPAGRFNATGANLAQHVTSSINVGAYPQLTGDQQQLLYRQGTGATSKKALYEKILDAITTQNQIKASTKQRNDAKHTVKTPVESMLAAEVHEGLGGAEAALKTVEGRDLPTTVSNDNGKSSAPIRDPRLTVQQIIERGEYPTIQVPSSDSTGSDGAGYLALAEKLQPPLLDPGNKQLRVLVEHRTDDLCTAVNQVLNGKPSQVWDDFVAAARAMDEKVRTGQ